MATRLAASRRTLEAGPGAAARSSSLQRGGAAIGASTIVGSTAAGRRGPGGGGGDAGHGGRPQLVDALGRDITPKPLASKPAAHAAQQASAGRSAGLLAANAGRNVRSLAASVGAASDSGSERDGMSAAGRTDDTTSDAGDDDASSTTSGEGGEYGRGDGGGHDHGASAAGGAAMDADDDGPAAGGLSGAQPGGGFTSNGRFITTPSFARAVTRIAGASGVPIYDDPDGTLALMETPAAVVGPPQLPAAGTRGAALATGNVYSAIGASVRPSVAVDAASGFLSVAAAVRAASTATGYGGGPGGSSAAGVGGGGLFSPGPLATTAAGLVTLASPAPLGTTLVTPAPGGVGGGIAFPTGPAGPLPLLAAQGGAVPSTTAGAHMALPAAAGAAAAVAAASGSIALLPSSLFLDGFPTGLPFGVTGGHTGAAVGTGLLQPPGLVTAAAAAAAAATAAASSSARAYAAGAAAGHLFGHAAAAAAAAGASSASSHASGRSHASLKGLPASVLQSLVSIDLEETDTIMMLAIPSTRVQQDSQEHRVVVAANEKYDALKAAVARAGGEMYPSRGVSTLAPAVKHKETTPPPVHAEAVGVQASEWAIADALAAEERNAGIPVVAVSSLAAPPTSTGGGGGGDAVAGSALAGAMGSAILSGPSATAAAINAGFAPGYLLESHVNALVSTALSTTGSLVDPESSVKMLPLSTAAPGAALGGTSASGGVGKGGVRGSNRAGASTAHPGALAGSSVGGGKGGGGAAGGAGSSAALMTAAGSASSAIGAAASVPSTGSGAAGVGAGGASAGALAVSGWGLESGHSEGSVDISKSSVSGPAGQAAAAAGRGGKGGGGGGAAAGGSGATGINAGGRGSSSGGDGPDPNAGATDLRGADIATLRSVERILGSQSLRTSLALAERAVLQNVYHSAHRRYRSEAGTDVTEALLEAGRSLVGGHDSAAALLAYAGAHGGNLPPSMTAGGGGAGEADARATTAGGDAVSLSLPTSLRSGGAAGGATGGVGSGGAGFATAGPGGGSATVTITSPSLSAFPLNSAGKQAGGIAAATRARLLGRSDSTGAASTGGGGGEEDEEEAGGGGGQALSRAGRAAAGVAAPAPGVHKLWSYWCPQVEGRGVSCMAWNKRNRDLLAVGYGRQHESAGGSSAIVAAAAAATSTGSAALASSAAGGFNGELVPGTVGSTALIEKAYATASGSGGPGGGSTPVPGGGAGGGGAFLFSDSSSVLSGASVGAGGGGGTVTFAVGGGGAARGAAGAPTAAAAAAAAASSPAIGRPASGCGLIALWSLSNPEWPQAIFTTPDGAEVTALEFADDYPTALAAGLATGAVCVYDIQQAMAGATAPSTGSGSGSTGTAATVYGPSLVSDRMQVGAHSEGVWQLKWVAKADGSGSQVLVSVSSDGRVTSWDVNKGLVPSPLIVLKRARGVGETAAAASAASSTGSGGQRGAAGADILGLPAGSGARDGILSRTACGLCLDFMPEDTSQYYVGTEEGLLARCSTSYAEQYLEVIPAHAGPVNRVRLSPFDASALLTCSADWTIRLWDVGAGLAPAQQAVASSAAAASGPSATAKHAAAAAAAAAAAVDPAAAGAGGAAGAAGGDGAAGGAAAGGDGSGDAGAAGGSSAPPAPPQRCIVYSVPEVRDAIVDVVWSPTVATVFAAITRDGHLQLWEAGSLSPLLDHTIRLEDTIWRSRLSALEEKRAAEAAEAAAEARRRRRAEMGFEAGDDDEEEERVKAAASAAASAAIAAARAAASGVRGRRSSTIVEEEEEEIGGGASRSPAAIARSSRDTGDEGGLAGAAAAAAAAARPLPPPPCKRLTCVLFADTNTQIILTGDATGRVDVFRLHGLDAVMDTKSGASATTNSGGGVDNAQEAVIQADAAARAAAAAAAKGGGRGGFGLAVGSEAYEAQVKALRGVLASMSPV